MRFITTLPIKWESSCCSLSHKSYLKNPKSSASRINKTKSLPLSLRYGALNGRKVPPSFCSNNRYYCTVYKDEIPRPVFNIDNPWTNIFLPVCQSQKCQWRAGRHPRAGSLSLLDTVLPWPQGGLGVSPAEPPCCPHPGSPGPPVRYAGKCVPGSQPHPSLHTRTL